MPTSNIAPDDRGSALIFRPVSGPIRVRLPYEPDNRTWIKSLNIRGAKWNAERKFWELPRASWHKALAGLRDRFATVRDVRDDRINDGVICNVKCQTAVSPDCECSCGGQFHQIQVGGVPLGDGSVMVVWEKKGIKRTERFHRR